MADKPVVVTERDAIRNASGDYFCPKCKVGKIRPTVAECPNCGATLYWELPPRA